MSSVVKSNHFSPGVLSMLPLFYVGWSDSVLSPSEIKLIHKTLDSIDFLSDDDKNYLISHTDPKMPPSAQVFKSWLKAIRDQADQIENGKKCDLVGLGMAIAESSGMLTNGSEQAVKTKAALTKVSEELGIDNPCSEHLLIEQLSEDGDLNDGSIQSIVTGLAEVLDAPYTDLRNRMKILLTDPLFNQDAEPDKEIYRLKVLKQVKALGQQGVSAFSFPKRFGGKERRGDHIVVFEMLAYGDLSLMVKFGVQFGLFGGAVYSLGTESHHKKYVEAMHRAELLGCFAMTETGHGSNVRELLTTATYDHTTKEIIIHSPSFDAGKEYIGNALHSEMAAVFAQLIVDGVNHGVHCVLVPLRKGDQLLDGIKVEDCGYKIGLNGVDNGRIWFDNVRVPVENLLNKYGSIDANGAYTSPIKNDGKRFFTMLGALVTGRISVGAAANNCAKKALTIATKYALHRRQFAGKPSQKETIIMDYPTHQDRIIPAIAKTYAYHFALRDLTHMYTESDDVDSRKIETLAAGLKSKASWHATETIQMCREACGGKGYLSENQIGQIKADSDIFTTFEGDNTVLMQLVAKGLLTEFKQNFHDEGFRAVISFLLRKAKHKIKEINVIDKNNIDQGHLMSIDFISDAFAYRYNKILINLSERMRKYLGRKIDPYQAFLKTQIHMTELADAYIDMVCLDSMTDAMQKCEKGKTQKMLKQIIQVYGVNAILDRNGWYLEAEYISSNQSKALRRVKNKLLQMTRPFVGELVDAFGIPQELLRAPIAAQEFS